METVSKFSATIPVSREFMADTVDMGGLMQGAMREIALNFTNPRFGPRRIGTFVPEDTYLATLTPDELLAEARRLFDIVASTGECCDCGADGPERHLPGRTDYTYR